MVPRIIEQDSIILAGIDFYGYPYEEAGGWSSQNAIGELWDRFTRFCDMHEDGIKHQVAVSASSGSLLIPSIMRGHS